MTRVRFSVPPLLAGSSSSNTTRSLRVNDTTLTDEPTSDWLAMQSITEYSDNSTRRVPPLGFPPNASSAVSVGPRPTCTLARRHGTTVPSLRRAGPPHHPATFYLRAPLLANLGTENLHFPWYKRIEIRVTRAQFAWKLTSTSAI